MSSNVKSSKSESYNNRYSKAKNIETNKPLSTYGVSITEEKVKRTLNIVMNALKNRDSDSVKEMLVEYEMLIGISSSRLRSYFSENEMQYSFGDFLKIVATKPMEDWLFPKGMKGNMRKMLGKEVLVSGRRINEIVEEYMGSYKNLKDEEQNLIRPMLSELRQFKTNPQVQELYTLIRDNLVAKHGEFDFDLNRPKSNIWTPKEKTKFEAKLAKYEYDLPNMCRFFREECFEEIVGPQYIEICNNCGLPMKLQNGEYVCENEITCDHNQLVKDLNRRVLNLKAGDKVFVVKSGIGFYITRTGIEETIVYNMVKEKYEPQGWKVVKYPGQDSDGDVLMTKGDISIYIDLKDYVSASALEDELRESPGQYKTKDVIYIPQYRKDIYELKGTLSGLKSTIANELKRDDGTAPVLAFKNNLVRTLNKIIKEKMKG